MVRQRVATLAVLLVPALVLSVACGSGGGSDDSDPIDDNGVNAGFAADQPAPGAKTVAMSEEDTAADEVTVDVAVTDTSNVYGIAFDVTFDASNVEFEDWDAGTLLEQDGKSVDYQVEEQVGRLVVTATRQGNVTGASAVGTKPIIRLTFRVKEIGGYPLNFDGDPTLYDGQLQPQEINVTWFAGDLTGA